MTLPMTRNCVVTRTRCPSTARSVTPRRDTPRPGRTAPVPLSGNSARPTNSARASAITYQILPPFFTLSSSEALDGWRGRLPECRDQAAQGIRHRPFPCRSRQGLAVDRSIRRSGHTHADDNERGRGTPAVGRGLSAPSCSRTSSARRLRSGLRTTRSHQRACVYRLRRPSGSIAAAISTVSGTCSVFIKQNRQCPRILTTCSASARQPRISIG